MTLAPASALATLRARLSERLERMGFAWSRSTAVRSSRDRTDVLSIGLVRQVICEKWGVPYGSIFVEPACYLPFIPSTEARNFTCARIQIDQPTYLSCQIRFGVQRRSEEPKLPRATNLWLLGKDNVRNERVTKDIIALFDEIIVRFFEFMSDLDQLLKYLQTQDDLGEAGGIWNIGKIGSFRRFFIQGFVALEIGEWQVAEDSLKQCIVVIEEKKLNVPSNVLNCIRYGISLSNLNMRLPEKSL